jgi:hypothetical protein
MPPLEFRSPAYLQSKLTSVAGWREISGGNSLIAVVSLDMLLVRWSAPAEIVASRLKPKAGAGASVSNCSFMSSSEPRSLK